jgi:arginase
MLNIVIPQWQGGGQDLCTWYGAYALRDNYLSDLDSVTVDIGREPLSPEKNHILGYDDILRNMDKVNNVLKEKDPSGIFTVGGGCDADTPCAAWLNRKYKGDMAVVYIDAHGDLNTPDTSESRLYYGMSLRALLSDGDPGIIGRLASTIKPDQLIMGAGRNLDPEERRYIRENRISHFTVEQLEADPEAVAKELIRKGSGNVYIHIDFDSLDPEEFALTPVQEPDGLKGSTLLSMISAINKSGIRIVGFGLLEYSGTTADRGDFIVGSLVSCGKSIEV